MKLIILILTLIFIPSLKSADVEPVIITNITKQTKLIPFPSRKASVEWGSRGRVDEFHVQVWVSNKYRMRYTPDPTYIYVTKKYKQQILLPKTGWAKVNVVAVMNKIPSNPSWSYEFLDGRLMRIEK